MTRPGGEVRLDLERGTSGATRSLPYRITYTKRTEPETRTLGDRTITLRPVERLSIATLYRAEGTVAVGDHELDVAFLDVNADGRFDESDFRRGTAVGIDLDGDGRFRSAHEWIAHEQIFLVGDRLLLADPKSAAPDGSSFAVRPSSVSIPEVGKEPPARFALEAADGTTLSSGELRGKLRLLDSGASWCAPCVATLPRAKEREQEGELEVLYLNTDVAARLAGARRIAAEKELPPERSFYIGGEPITPCGRCSARVEPDPTLWRRARRGDRRAIERIVAGCGPAVWPASARFVPLFWRVAMADAVIRATVLDPAGEEPGLAIEHVYKGPLQDLPVRLPRKNLLPGNRPVHLEPGERAVFILNVGSFSAPRQVGKAILMAVRASAPENRAPILRFLEELLGRFPASPVAERVREKIERLRRDADRR